jgi:hypothetical protein
MSHEGRMKKGVIRLMLGLPMILLLEGCQITHSTHSGFFARRAELKSVTVLPCQCHELVATGRGMQDQTSAGTVWAVDRCLQESLGGQLRARGWTVADGHLTE